ncbi:hypothetical protein HPB51_006624 [Rhipicephalus microplus]|uniref:Phosphoribosylglycinamide synthetase N-terminal domain-containing protein n=1 Tax=Rhipicephalus microplus TaxID=6941 RepID=A0A9J6E7U1_RHIMP|nr:hypothetical protein HPB51_006624 [Rhipicephalus microplus]
MSASQEHQDRVLNEELRMTSFYNRTTGEPLPPGSFSYDRPPPWIGHGGAQLLTRFPSFQTQRATGRKCRRATFARCSLECVAWRKRSPTNFLCGARRASSAMYDKVLVIGNGGREHAIVWKLAQSPRIQTIYVAPGNAGTSTESKAVNVDLDVKSNKSVVDWCKANGIALVAIGPEEYLCRGLADDLEAAGVKCFRPQRQGSRNRS